jgi:hypothetical protein
LSRRKRLDQGRRTWFDDIRHLKKQEGVAANAFVTDDDEIEEESPSQFLVDRCSEVWVDRKHSRASSVTFAYLFDYFSFA